MSEYTQAGSYKYEYPLHFPKTSGADVELIKPGYKFKEWRVRSIDGAVITSPTTMPANNLVAFAVWVSNTYIIHYDKNAVAASGTMVDQECECDVAITLLPNNFNNPGFQFIGWSTNPNDTAAMYADMATVSDLVTGDTASVILYAIWLGADHTAYTVNHYKETFTDGEYAAPEIEILYGTTDENTRAQAKSYPGFTLKAQPVQQKIKADGSTTIDIQYTRNAHTLNWNAGGGTFTE